MGDVQLALLKHVLGTHSASGRVRVRDARYFKGGGEMKVRAGPLDVSLYTYRGESQRWRAQESLASTTVLYRVSAIQGGSLGGPTRGVPVIDARQGAPSLPSIATCRAAVLAPWVVLSVSLLRIPQYSAMPAAGRGGGGGGQMPPRTASAYCERATHSSSAPSYCNRPVPFEARLLEAGLKEGSSTGEGSCTLRTPFFLLFPQTSRVTYVIDPPSFPRSAFSCSPIPSPPQRRRRPSGTLPQNITLHT